MRALRRLFGIEDTDHSVRANILDEKIHEARQEYDKNLLILESRKNSQGLSNGERVMETWSGAMKMLRDVER